jgi:hypothetical protein
MGGTVKSFFEKGLFDVISGVILKIRIDLPFEFRYNERVLRARIKGRI